MSWDDDVKAAAKELKRLSEMAEKHLGKLFESEDPKDKPVKGKYAQGGLVPPPGEWSSVSWRPMSRAPLRIGQFVHYRSHGSADGDYSPECRPAIITRLHPDRDNTPLGLMVVGDGGIFFKKDTPEDQTKFADGFTGGRWHRDRGQ